MSALLPLLVLAAMVAIAVLALRAGPDDRPGINDPPDGWVGNRS
jgi:hypothetical protein